MKIRLKDGTAEWSMFSELDPRVCLVFFDMVDIFRRHGVNEIVITSMIRPRTNDSGVHALGRAIDVSDNGINHDLIMMVQEYINVKYPYDPARPSLQTFVYHEGSGYNGDKAMHIHLQVL